MEMWVDIATDYDGGDDDSEDWWWRWGGGGGGERRGVWWYWSDDQDDVDHDDEDDDGGGGGGDDDDIIINGGYRFYQVARLTWWTRFDKLSDTDKMETARDDDEIKLAEINTPIADGENNTEGGEEDNGDEEPTVVVEGELLCIKSFIPNSKSTFSQPSFCKGCSGNWWSNHLTLSPPLAAKAAKLKSGVNTDGC